MLKTIRLLSLAFLIAFVSALARVVRTKAFPDSGYWTKTRHPRMLPVTWKSRIKQDGSGVTMESTFKEPENGIVPLLYLGIMTTRMHLSFDGNTQQNQIGPFQMASKTTLNGNKMDTEWTAAVKDDQVQGHWKHAISDDGKHMTLEIKENSTQGQTAQATLHFVKK